MRKLIVAALILFATAPAVAEPVMKFPNAEQSNLPELNQPSDLGRASPTFWAMGFAGFGAGCTVDDELSVNPSKLFRGLRNTLLNELALL